MFQGGRSPVRLRGPLCARFRIHREFRSSTIKMTQVFEKVGARCLLVAYQETWQAARLVACAKMIRGVSGATLKGFVCAAAWQNGGQDFLFSRAEAPPRGVLVNFVQGSSATRRKKHGRTLVKGLKHFVTVSHQGSLVSMDDTSWTIKSCQNDNAMWWREIHGVSIRRGTSRTVDVEERRCVPPRDQAWKTQCHALRDSLKEADVKFTQPFCGTDEGNGRYEKMAVHICVVQVVGGARYGTCCHARIFLPRVFACSISHCSSLTCG